MRLLPKVLFTIIPLVLSATIGLGYWHYTTTKKNSIEALYRLIETAMEIQLLDELNSKTKLLEASKMTEIDYFVDHYQNEVLDTFKKDAKYIEGGHIFIFTKTGQLLFSSSNQSQETMETVWLDSANLAISSGRTKGYIKSPPYESYFVAQYFSPWEWVVFLSIKDKEIESTILDIRKTTIIVTTALALSTIIFLVLFFKFVLLGPIHTLQHIASQVTLQKPIQPVPIKSNDEIGSLTKEMEKMASAIFSYTREQKDLQDKLQKSNESLKVSEEKFRFAILHAPFPIMIHADGGEVIKVNNTWEELTGYSHKDIPTVFDWTQKAYGQRADQAQNDIQTLYELETRIDQGIYEITKADGSKATWDFSSSPLGRPQSGKRLVITMAKDVTANVQAQLEQEKLRRKLIQAQKMEAIGTLAGGIAHDFNNILSSIIGFTDLALEQVEPGSVQESDLKEVYTAGIRAKELVQQILAFAQQSEGNIKPHQLSEIITEALKLLRPTLPTTIEIKQTLSSNSFVLCDSTQMFQVINNLCINSAQAMKDHGGVLEIKVDDIIAGPTLHDFPQQSYGQTYLALSISDTGVGIDPTIIDTIFEPYFTTKAIGEGTGMGLSMVKGIIEKHGGMINVTSTPNKETTFTVYLPVTEQKDQQIPHSTNLITPGSERILLVDDEEQITSVGHRILQRLGYEVTITNSSTEALELFMDNPDTFDLIITDMTMPHMTGLKLIEKIRGARPEVPVILCSGFSQNLSDEKITQLGVNAFLNKPITKDELELAVTEILKTS